MVGTGRGLGGGGSKMVAAQLMLVNHFFISLTHNSQDVGGPFPDINSVVVDLSCSHGCSRCSPINGCLACKPPFFLVLHRDGTRQTASCSRSCPRGFYKLKKRRNGFCSKCTMRGCEACVGPRYCSTCQHHYLNFFGTCIRQSPDNELEELRTLENQPQHLFPGMLSVSGKNVTRSNNNKYSDDNLTSLYNNNNNNNTNRGINGSISIITSKGGEGGAGTGGRLSNGKGIPAGNMDWNTNRHNNSRNKNSDNVKNNNRNSHRSNDSDDATNNIRDHNNNNNNSDGSFGFSDSEDNVWLSKAYIPVKATATTTKTRTKAQSASVTTIMNNNNSNNNNSPTNGTRHVLTSPESVNANPHSVFANLKTVRTTPGSLPADVCRNYWRRKWRRRNRGRKRRGGGPRTSRKYRGRRRHRERKVSRKHHVGGEEGPTSTRAGDNDRYLRRLCRRKMRRRRRNRRRRRRRKEKTQNTSHDDALKTWPQVPVPRPEGEKSVGNPVAWTRAETGKDAIAKSQFPEMIDLSLLSEGGETSSLQGLVNATNESTNKHSSSSSSSMSSSSSLPRPRKVTTSSHHHPHHKFIYKNRPRAMVEFKESKLYRRHRVGQDGKLRKMRHEEKKHYRRRPGEGTGA